MSIEPIPLSEREKQTQKILDFAQDMYDDEDYNKYIWAVAKSQDSGKTFQLTAGRLPVGMSLTCKPDAEIAPIAPRPTIEPNAYTIQGVSASEFMPEHHPIALLKAQHVATPQETAWEAFADKDKEFVLTFDLGEDRVIGAVEFWPSKPGKYSIEISTSQTSTHFLRAQTTNIENVGPATSIMMPALTKDRYIQIVTNCNSLKQVRILSMSENATQEEKERLSTEFYEQKITKSRRKG